VTAWAQQTLPAKNTLTDTDARLVEERFSRRVSTFADPPLVGDLALAAARSGDGKPQGESPESGDGTGSEGAPYLAPKTVRLRDKAHRKFLSRQPCLVCGRVPSEAHHLRFAQPRALGRKVSDQFTVPLCRLHHRELHRHGDEVTWWAAARSSPSPSRNGCGIAAARAGNRFPLQEWAAPWERRTLRD
jgi:hypothetical protein